MPVLTVFSKKQKQLKHHLIKYTNMAIKNKLTTSCFLSVLKSNHNWCFPKRVVNHTKFLVKKKEEICTILKGNCVQGNRNQV